MSVVSTIPSASSPKPPSRLTVGPSRPREPGPLPPKPKQPIPPPRSRHSDDTLDASRPGSPKVRRRRRKSVHRTRTWADEVDAQRLCQVEHGQPPPAMTETVSAHVIDSLVDALDPEERYRGPLPTAASVISSLNRQRRPTPFSSDEESLQASPHETKPTMAKQGTEKSSSTRPVRAEHRPPLTPSTNSPLLSIDEIIKRHSPAIVSAVDAVKEKARKDLGLPASPCQSLQSPRGLPPSPPSLSSPSDEHPVTPLSAPQVTPLPIKSSSQRPEDLDLDDLGSDLLAGQAYMAKLETVSLASESLRSSLSTAPSPQPSSRAEGSIRSKHKSLPAEMLEQQDHTMARYLRSPKLNRYLSIRRPAPDPPLQVSLADVGAPEGLPLVVFLGIGCVRYLIAMFDDLAQAHGVRIICIDRWGLGKTGNVPRESRSPLEWAAVVEQVLDQLDVHQFNILAHSAGAPYAIAAGLWMEKRVKGKIHLLAPWVSAEIDGGYKWLKWVPTGVIEGAFAADWKMQTYRLGKPPPLVHKPVSHIVESSPRPSLDRTSSGGSRGSTPERSPRRSGSGMSRRASQILGGIFKPASTTTIVGGASDGLSFTASESGPKRWATSTEVITLRSTSSDEPDSFDYERFSQELSKAAARGEGTKNPPVDAALLLALEQASHAECEPGTTEDIMSIILNRPRRSWGFSYTDLQTPVVIWWGDADERISEKSVRWMERCMVAELRVVPGADHNLMRRMSVLCDVLQDVADSGLTSHG